jgi:hypothetical protein
MPRPPVPIVAGLAALVGTEVPGAPIRRNREEVPR